MIEQGFRPVWHMGTEELDATAGLPAQMRDRRVSYEPGRTDWLAEREWRLCWGDMQIPAGHVPTFSLSGLLLAIIVGKQGWDPPYGATPVPHRGLARGFWRGDTVVADGFFNC